MDFMAWDEAIANRLSDVRQQLIDIPVAALPREAGKFGSDEFESIDWLIPEYSANPLADLSSTSQDVVVTLVVRLHFTKRYPLDIEKDVLEWAEQQILTLLTGYRLPDSLDNLVLVSGRLFAPRQGQWYKELTWRFTTRVYPSQAVVTPLVEVIGVDSRGSKLIEASL